MLFDIRLANKEDIEYIIDIYNLAIENHLPNKLTEIRDVVIAALREAMETRICILVAEVAGRVVGFSMIDEDLGVLCGILVLPEFSKQGAKQGLLCASEHMLFKSHSVIWLETNRNHGTLPLYLCHGWKIAEDITVLDVRMLKIREQIIPIHFH